MDVRVFIVWQPTNIYQAFILAPEVARGWLKTYTSKLECITELRCIDLLTPTDADDALADDFDILDRILIVRSHIDPATLEDIRFDETKAEMIS